MQNLEREVEKQRNQIIKLRKESVLTYKTVVDMTDEVNSLMGENIELDRKTKKYEKLQSEIYNKWKVINDLKQKLATYDPRNIN